ncbi:hypothetical protein [Pantoea sp. SJZ147]|nr:hypothetical protein [Pantoea sp. SJZ147]TWD33395.1 hypothetical protein FBY13_116118 [Pantoea sp. SJZ147]
MKEKKDRAIGLRITESQERFLQKLIQDGKAKNVSAAIQYLIALAMVKGA